MEVWLIWWNICLGLRQSLRCNTCVRTLEDSQRFAYQGAFSQTPSKFVFLLLLLSLLVSSIKPQTKTKEYYVLLTSQKWNLFVGFFKVWIWLYFEGTYGINRTVSCVWRMLQEMEANVTANCVHPGIVRTRLTREREGLITG